MSGKTSTLSTDEESSYRVDPAQDLQAFLKLWNRLGERLIADTHPEDLAGIVDAADTGAFASVEVSVYEDIGDGDHYSINTNLELWDDKKLTVLK